MKLALHILWKDVRHLWLPLTLWAVLMLLDLLVAGILLGRLTSVRDYRIARVVAFVLPPLQTLLLVISVPLIVHEDPTVGTTSFWLTRPIRPRTMLAAKAASVAGLFVVAPTLVEVAVLRLHGILPPDIGLATPEVLLSWTWWATTVAALAVLTQNFARFALVGAVVTVTSILLSLAEVAANLYLGRPRVSEENFVALASSQSLVQSFLYVAVGGAVVAHQYLTRRTRRSVLMALAGALLAFGVGTAWPWTFLPGGPTGRSPYHAPGMAVDVTPSHVAEHSLAPGYASDSLQVLGHLRVGGVPQEHAVDALVIRSDLAYPAEAPVTFDGSRRDAVEAWVSPRWDPDLVRRVLGGVSFVNPEHAPDLPLVLSLVKRSVYQTHRGVEGTYRALVSVSVLRYDVRGSRPLTRGAPSDDLSQVAILSVERQANAIAVLARETFLQLLLRGEPKWLGASTWSELGRRVLYVLRNRDRGEALWPAHHPLTDVDPLILFEILSDRPLKQHVRRLVYESAAPISQEWLKQAELVRIEAHEVGSTTRDVVIVPFVLPHPLR